MPTQRIVRFCLALLACACVVGLAACGGEEPATAGFPDVKLEVALAGAPERATPVPVAEDFAPSFTDGRQRAWTLDTLFARVRGGSQASLQVHQADGTRTELPHPFREVDGEVWALRANRRGEVQVLLLDPRDPFPAHHGRGGSRGRGGVARTLRDIVRIRLVVDPAGATDPSTRPAKGDPATPETAMLALTVTIDGTARALDAEALAELDPIEIQGDDGKGTRDAWNLRKLVTALGGEGARLTVVHGRGGRLLELTAADWSKDGRDPVLRLNRRGQLKFHWSSADGTPQAGGEVRDVTKLDIVSR